MKDRRFIYASILVSVFLLTVGLTYAYFSITASGNDVAETINVSATKIELKYTDGKEINVSNIEPGWTTTKTITVVNTGNEEAYYALGWQKLYNEIQKEELIIRSTCTSSGATGGTCSSTDNVVIPQTAEVNAAANKVLYPYKENVLILPGETHTYTITIEFINYTDKHQNYNQGKRFYGTLGAAESSKKLTFAEYLIENHGTLGLTEIEQTATGNQNYATTEYRYQGKTPNNYITFNGEDNVWRIIGVFEVETPNEDGTYTKENKVKLIRDSIETNIAWNENGSEGDNNWTTSTLMTTLNSGDYYNRTGTYLSNGLTTEAKSQISTTKWYLGNGDNNKSAKDLYVQERNTSVHSGNSQIWNGKVALMYPSDYLYASSTCYNNGVLGNGYSDSTCTSTNWLYSGLRYWSVTPVSVDKLGALYVNNAGNLMNGLVIKSSTAGLCPSIYLSPNIKYVSGDGTSDNPFVIE